jgi:hypothetical protein
MLSTTAVVYAALALGAHIDRRTVPQCADNRAEISSFEFASNPWLNLSNFLLKQAKQRRGIEDDALGARGYISDDTSATRALSSAETIVWDSVVDYFARVVVPDRMGIDSLVQNVNNVLARTAPNDGLDGTHLPQEFRRAMEAAMPIYRSAWWPTHDRRNREWIESMQLELSEHEACLAQRAASVFRAPWPSVPIVVDASVYASWFGAYSTHHPTRITVTANARGSQGLLGLEVLLHETAHGMLGPLDFALAAEATRQQKKLPTELSHLVLFYTAGALMREQEPSYVPFAEAFGIWHQNRYAQRYHDLIEREWQPYLSGSRTFTDAVASLVERLQ